MPSVRGALLRGQRIRGVGLSTVDMEDAGQQELFFQESEKKLSLYRVLDTINNTYGLDTVMKAAHRYDVGGKTHFLER